MEHELQSQLYLLQSQLKDSTREAERLFKACEKEREKTGEASITYSQLCTQWHIETTKCNDLSRLLNETRERHSKIYMSKFQMFKSSRNKSTGDLIQKNAVSEMQAYRKKINEANADNKKDASLHNKESDIANTEFSVAEFLSEPDEKVKPPVVSQGACLPPNKVSSQPNNTIQPPDEVADLERRFLALKNKK